MVEPLSVSIGVGIAILIALAAYGLYAAGAIRARSPEHIVDMREVANYYRHTNANEALSQDVDDDEGS